MKYRTLGRDLTVSAISLGCMGMTHAFGAPSDTKEMTKLIHEAVELGTRCLTRRSVTPERSRTAAPPTMKNW